jgi:hypothetical protein
MFQILFGLPFWPLRAMDRLVATRVLGALQQGFCWDLNLLKFQLVLTDFVCHSLMQLSESFLRSCQFCSYSRTSQYFIEPESSLPCSQEPSTGLHPKPFCVFQFENIMRVSFLLGFVCRCLYFYCPIRVSFRL